MTFTVLNGFPIPAPDRENPVRRRLIDISGRLAAVDERYTDWAEVVGVPVGLVREDERDDLLAELDACVALLYGLEEDEVRHIYATFHYGWDHEPWTEAVLEHYRALTGLTQGGLR